MIDINPSFKLKDPKNPTKKGSLIIMKLYYDYNRVVWSTNMNIDPQYWDKANQKAKRVNGDKDLNDKHKSINLRLGEIVTALEDLFRDYDRKRELPSPETIKEHLNAEFKPRQEKADIKFLDFIDILITESRNGTRKTKRGSRFNEGTVKGYETTLKHLKDFHRVKRQPINFDNINLNFYNRFVDYLQGLSLSTNTIGGQVKNLKVFIREAYKQGHTQNRVWEEEDFIVFQEEADKVFLSLEELDKIYELDLSSKKKLDNVRDFFLLGCYTALRFSDLARIRPEHIIKNGTQLRIRTQKTGEVVVIPLHPVARAILDKHEGTAPRAISNQKFNDYIKDVAEEAGIDEPVSFAITKGGMRVDTTKPKYELISSHTARRSGATNMYLTGVPAISIMKITGHKTEKAFMKYIRISQEDNANKLLEHPFFSGKTQMKAV